MEKKIKNRRINFVSKFGGKSEVWNHFKQVMGIDNICVGFVECIKCSTLVTLFIKAILNRFLYFKHLEIVVENISNNRPSIKQLSGLNRAWAHNYS